MSTSKSGPGWSSTGVVKGIREVNCESWAGFISFCTEPLIRMPGYVYRGQGDAAWPLLPTLQRLLLKNHPKKRIERESTVLSRHLKKFKYATRGRLPFADRQGLTDDDWWALGQHHGLATPLLDWSESPFVAAFFAFSDENIIEPESTDVAIYALSKNSVGRINKKIEMDYLQLKFIEPLRDDNPRLVSQRGLFTKTMSIKTVEEWVKKHAPPGAAGGTLLKINIPRSETQHALLSLNRMNINNLSLFPDLYGACHHSNMSLTTDKYG